MRYWNGLAWTERVAPNATSAPPTGPTDTATSGYGPDHALHWLVPVGRSGASMAAGYMGLACMLLFWIGPFAVLLALATVGVSLRALTKAKTGGHGRGRAIARLVMAAIGGVGGILFPLAWTP
jgi:hypothetical protein